ncbi:iron ABC transporter substrate-binding protein [Pandoraea faecigallinarum]|uniref:Iron ABC transporter substrate-binding protein n=1 Tax=Pandoraea faecigallinarum TaxID=656179 RepID=A0A0H3WTX3_9BURK|nr:ABC transporter substrate-binding protein [Pandoraea faecigallinarum]AKM31182.1 iron ABC transporter substrate-binding protein [Pandoraea faecigallinarum]
MKRLVLLGCAAFGLVATSSNVAAGPKAAAHYPVTVRSCNRTVTFERAPERAVSNDVNLTEMMIALGLRPRMIGFTGISGWKTANPALRRQLAGLPELAQRYPSIEVLVQAGADFYFAGWNYGVHVGGPVTPAMLAPMGIRTYELSESCAHVMPRGAASFDDVYNDLRNLGRIFDVESAAHALVDRMKTRLEALKRRVDGARAPVRTFVYDSGEDSPFTAGRLAMPTALIGAAGGRNVMDDVAQSWTRVSWETVVARNPQAIVIVDYGAITAAQKIAFLLDQPALRQVEAIRARRFIVVPYDEATPGIRNVQAVETIARGLHPQAFAK